MFPRQTQTAPPGCNRNTGFFLKRFFRTPGSSLKAPRFFLFRSCVQNPCKKLRKKNHARTATSPRPTVLSQVATSQRYRLSTRIRVGRCCHPRGAAVETKTIHPLATAPPRDKAFLSSLHATVAVSFSRELFEKEEEKKYTYTYPSQDFWHARLFIGTRRTATIHRHEGNHTSRD